MRRAKTPYPEPGPVTSVARVTSTLLRRPMAADDAARWAELLAACEAHDVRGEHWSVQDCADDLDDPELDLAADTELVLDDGRPVAYQMLRLRVSALGRRLHAEAAVHPAHRGRGIGTELLASAQRHAAERDAVLELRIAEDCADAVELAVAAGLTAVRWWSDLRRDLVAEPVVPLPVPDGLTVQALGPPYDAARWDEPLRAAHNAAFADHWGSAPVGAAAWAHGRTNHNFRPDCSAAAVTGSGEVAGYLLAYEFAEDTARTGARELHVATLGTVLEWRGRGVAGALLAHALAVGAADGFARSSLGVDAHNPTGALGIYDRAGYVRHRREVSWAGA